MSIDKKKKKFCAPLTCFLLMTLIFNELDLDNLRNLIVVLFCFEAISGLKINLSKLEIVPADVVPNILDLANILGCKITSLPLTYLGLTLGLLIISLLLFGMGSSKRLKDGWLVGKSFTYPKGAESLF